jgi:hypothetical protein
MLGADSPQRSKKGSYKTLFCIGEKKKIPKLVLEIANHPREKGEAKYLIRGSEPIWPDSL